ncbi:unnamed protein product [Orchesella dallaii]|uniref:Transmembrane protein n=1 Tax=Orchesella dallaii TaxID=48710 RepID=A0ABP1S2V3_9HEXA
MAVLGVQLAISMIMASIISKFGPRLSLARYLLCSTGLIRYLHPTDEELRELAGVPKDVMGKGKGKGKNQDYKNPNTFHVPKDLDIKLDSVHVGPAEVIHLRYYTEYQSVLDYTVYATIVYFATEVYYCFLSPKEEMNLSIYWCILTLLWCIKVLLSVTKVYFRGDEVMGERALCMCMGGVYLLTSMMFLIVDENTLEVGLDSAYDSFHLHASEFLKAQGLPSTGPASKLILKFVLAVFSALLGILFTFPGLRMSKMFYDSRRYCEGRTLVKAMLNLAYVFPLILTILWIRPVGRDILAKPFGGSDKALMSEAAFESLRLMLVVCMVVLRIAVMPFFLQSFLNVAQEKLIDQRKEAGRILNTDLQKKVAGIFYYLCIVAVQYVAPCLICLHSCFMYKTLGEGSWLGDLMAGNATVSDGTTPAFKPVLPDTDEVLPAAQHFAIALASLKVVFNATVFRGIFGYMTWWSTFLLIASSGVGSLYLSYGTRA